MGLGDRYSEYEKPAAYATLLVQRALALGACSQEAEGQAGKASSPDSAIRSADVMHAQSNSCEVCRPSIPVFVVTPTFNVPPLAFYVTCILCDVH